MKGILTPRRLEVMRLVANGYSNAEIGKELWISEQSVKTNLHLTFKALGAKDRAHATAICFALGLLTKADIRLHGPGGRAAA